MSRLLLFSAPCYLKTAFLLANHNREIFSCISLVVIFFIHFLVVVGFAGLFGSSVVILKIK